MIQHMLGILIYTKAENQVQNHVAIWKYLPCLLVFCRKIKGHILAWCYKADFNISEVRTASVKFSSIKINFLVSILSFNCTNYCSW